MELVPIIHRTQEEFDREVGNILDAYVAGVLTTVRTKLTAAVASPAPRRSRKTTRGKVQAPRRSRTPKEPSCPTTSVIDATNDSSVSAPPPPSAVAAISPSTSTPPPDVPSDDSPAAPANSAPASRPVFTISTRSYEPVPPSPALSSPTFQALLNDDEPLPSPEAWPLGDDGHPVEPPEIAQKRIRRRRERIRAITIAQKQITQEQVRHGLLQYPPDEFADVERPKTRRDCKPGGCNEQRPCPWVACKHHLYLDVNPETGSIKLNFPDLEPWELKETCEADVADRGGITLEETGDIMNLTRERIRQIEVRGLIHLKMIVPSPDELGAHLLEDHDDDQPRRRRRRQDGNQPEEDLGAAAADPGGP